MKVQTVAILTPYAMEVIGRALRAYEGPGSQNDYAKALAALVEKADSGKITRRVATKPSV